MIKPVVCSRKQHHLMSFTPIEKIPEYFNQLHKWAIIIKIKYQWSPTTVESRYPTHLFIYVFKSISMRIDPSDNYATEVANRFWYPSTVNIFEIYVNQWRFQKGRIRILTK